MALFVDLASLFSPQPSRQGPRSPPPSAMPEPSPSSISPSLGLGIAASALVSRSLRARELEKARRYATSALAATTAVAILIAVLTAIFTDPLLALLGRDRRGRCRRAPPTTRRGFPAIAGAVTCSFILRATGDPTRAMWVTLTAAAINGVLDRIIIFVLGLGLPGCRCQHACPIWCRCWSASRVSSGFTTCSHRSARAFSRGPAAGLRHRYPRHADPARGPFAAAYLTRIAAQFGDEGSPPWPSSTGWCLWPPLALSFLVERRRPDHRPDYGAGEFGRVRQSLHDAIIFACTSRC